MSRVYPFLSRRYLVIRSMGMAFIPRILWMMIPSRLARISSARIGLWGLSGTIFSSPFFSRSFHSVYCSGSGIKGSGCR